MTRYARAGAVTGANGFLGGALVARLLPDGGVRALFRQPCERSAACQRSGGEVVIGDLDDERAIAALVRGVETVYHCAATFTKTDPARSHRVNVAGTERLARAAAAAGVCRFVYVSSASVYAATLRRDRTFGEEVEPQRLHRLNHYSRTKYEGELAVREAARGSGLSWVILRPTNVYGLGSGPWFRQWERLLPIVPLAIGHVPIDLVYVKDVVDAIVRAARCPAAGGEVFNVGHEMVPMNRLIVEIGRLTGRHARVVPRAVDRPACVAVDRLFRLLTGSALSPSLVSAAYYPHAKAARVLGFAPRFALPEAFADMACRHEPAG